MKSNAVIETELYEKNQENITPNTPKKNSLFSERNKKILGYAFLIASFVISGIFAPEGAKYYAGWSMLPAVAIFLFVILTKSLIEGFLWSGMLAVFIKYKTNFFVEYQDHVLKTITDADTAYLAVVFLLLGIVIEMLRKSGAAAYFARVVAKKAKSSRFSLFFQWILSWVLSVDDYLQAFVIGASMGPVNDEFKVPREQTAYTIRATAVHTSSIIPIGSWVVFCASLLEQNKFAAAGSGVTEYMKVVPFMFYSIISLIIALLVTMGWFPKLGLIKKAYKRVEKGGSVFPPAKGSGASDVVEEEMPEPKKGVNMLTFLIPIVALIGACIYFDFNMQYGIGLAVMISGALFLIQGIFKMEDIFNIVFEGFNSMVQMTFLFIIGITMSTMISDLGFTKFIVGATHNIVDPHLLPVALFLLFCGTEFLVTFNWTLYMMVLPSVIGLAAATGANPYLCLGALFCAGLFGSNASFASDAGMCTAAATKLDLYEHNVSGLPYHFISFGIAAVLYLAAGYIF
ncbi:Na+/H+ antiporter NhaC family protein [Bacillus sp. JJ1764]|uniref:Na+/H+ antiporter NhaC family protein n=1 Tax=Bacillus sp. JJ1764 TaxID=3122964 RepID=UPI002FFE2728